MSWRVQSQISTCTSSAVRRRTRSTTGRSRKTISEETDRVNGPTRPRPGATVASTSGMGHLRGAEAVGRTLLHRGDRGQSDLERRAGIFAVDRARLAGADNAAERLQFGPVGVAHELGVAAGGRLGHAGG